MTNIWIVETGTSNQLPIPITNIRIVETGTSRQSKNEHKRKFNELN